VALYTHGEAYYGVNYMVKHILYIHITSCIFLQDMYTPLHIAAENGHVEAAGSLIKLGADLSATSEVSWYGIQHAEI